MPRNIRFVLLVLVACVPQTAVGQASFEGLGDLPGRSFRSDARDVSNDGTVVVGKSRSEFSLEAFRWTAEDWMLGLEDLPGRLFEYTFCFCVSEAGTPGGSYTLTITTVVRRTNRSTGTSPIGDN